jgi:hypothetical protein
VFLVGGGYLAARNAVEVDAGRAGHEALQVRHPPGVDVQNRDQVAPGEIRAAGRNL